MLPAQSVHQSCKQVAFITLSGSESVQHVVWACKWSLFLQCGGGVEGDGVQFNMSKWGGGGGWGSRTWGWQCKKELSHSNQQMSLTAFSSINFKRFRSFRSSLHYYDGSPCCSHLQSARQQCLWSNSSPRSLRCWPVESLSAHRTRILGKQQGERSGQWRYAWISVCPTRPSTRRDETRVHTLLLREHLLVAVSFVVALKLDVHSVSWWVQWAEQRRRWSGSAKGEKKRGSACTFTQPCSRILNVQFTMLPWCSIDTTDAWEEPSPIKHCI